MAYDLNNDIPLGALGSAYVDTATPVYPPKGMVIRAITFLADNIPTVMDTEILDGIGPQYFGTNSTESTAANYLGVTEAAAASATSAGVVTIADAAANLKIKKGQFVIIGADADSVSTGITVDSSAGNLTPIYQGPNAQGLVVKSLTGGTYGTTLTVTNADGSTVDLSSIDADNTLYFLDETHGVGGVESDGAKFPKGITVYGRWVKFVPAVATGDGGCICYFGH
jgi:hypothetical protein